MWNVSKNSVQAFKHSALTQPANRIRPVCTKARYFAGSGWLWAEPERTKLEKQYVQAMLTLARAAIDESRFDDAEALLRAAYRHVPCEESVTVLLLSLFVRTGGKNKGGCALQAILSGT